MNSLSSIALSLGWLACITACSTSSHVDAAMPLPDGQIPESDAHPIVNVTMNANDPSGSGTNTAETFLNVRTVAAGTFGKLFSVPVDGDQYAEPLYVGGISVAGKTRNVVFAATSNDSVYAFDADDPSGVKLWGPVSLGTPSVNPNDYVGNNLSGGGSQISTSCMAGTPRFMNEIGITSTPTVDVKKGLLYAVGLDVDAKTTVSNYTCVHTAPDAGANYCQPYSCRAPTYKYKLHALDITTGKEVLTSEAITATVDGAGGGTSSGKVGFDTMTHQIRTALLLANGNLYFATSGYTDYNAYHGWIFAYDAATLKQAAVYCDTCENGSSGGIWQSGRGLLADDAGSVYAVTGNGEFDVNTGGGDYGDSVLRLSPDLAKVDDYFSPFLSSYMGNNLLADYDEDLGSSGATMIPGTTLLLASGKLGIGYLVDRANLGKWAPTSDKVVQKVRLTWRTTKQSCTDGVGTADVFSTPVVWTGKNSSGATQTHVYVWAAYDNLREYVLDGNGQFSTKGVCFCAGQSTFAGVNITESDPPCAMPSSQNSEVGAPYGGGALATSSNGTETYTGILWATHANGNPNRSSVPGVFEAYDATNVAAPIWSSASSSSDTLGNWAKFTPPTVANGKVYVPTFSNQLVVYGLLAK